MQTQQNYFARQAVAVALVKMFQPQASFSICTLDSCAEALGIGQVDGAKREAFRLIHCVKWADMPDDMRSATFLEVLTALGIDLPNVRALFPSTKE